jgi:hypothetical protein
MLCICKRPGLARRVTREIKRDQHIRFDVFAIKLLLGTWQMRKPATFPFISIIGKVITLY